MELLNVQIPQLHMSATRGPRSPASVHRVPVKVVKILHEMDHMDECAPLHIRRDMKIYFSFMNFDRFLND